MARMLARTRVYLKDRIDAGGAGGFCRRLAADIDAAVAETEGAT